ncbi:threonine synthase [Clostridium sp. MSJ-11]|uniref:Threonine synthase n=1 Tax=Clostridium mobile TaxID=2841512 RepID=A0ABS6EL64_9CLOT|nr:threonine synthase [Clostridium mobile]MBU5485411.1 threonine synthase [Clostridium mobile]
MKLLYKSTRGNEEVGSSQAIINGLATDGGLYIPKFFPKIDLAFDELIEYDYKQLAVYVLKKYLTDFTEEEILYCVNNAYDNKFESREISPLVKKGDEYYLELYHGPTLAFKDMALSILPYLMRIACNKVGIKEEIVILTATSGDTGKAALEGFGGVDGIKIIVFYPENGVSPIQKFQMITQKEENTLVVGIDGNFDDAQNGVKEIFEDRKLNKELKDNGYILSSANSINIGRLLPQIVYYIYSYTSMLKKGYIALGESINISVPTGNFGNILAAYYAKQMGLPINKLICASNENNVLWEFFNKGNYNRNREFKITSSPSMDILISSNLERLLYHISDDVKVEKMMINLKEKGEYSLSEEMLSRLNEFYSSFATDEETYEIIKKIYESQSYLIDTHTAVGYKAYRDYKEGTKDNTKTVLVSTASPFKFTKDICIALGIDENLEAFKLGDKLSSYTGIQVPSSLKKLEKNNIIHKTKCKKKEMKKVIKNYLKV